MVSFAEIVGFAKENLAAEVPHDAVDFDVTHVSSVSGWNPGGLAFAVGEQADLLERSEGIQDAALIVSRDHPPLPCPCLRVADPRYAFARIADRFFRTRPAAGIHPQASVDIGASIHPTATVGPFCVIGPNVTIGPRTILHDHVVIAPGVSIGSDCEFWSHVAIGGDGFGVAQNGEGHTFAIPHFGGVHIGNHVRLGNFTAVHAGTLDPTILEDRVVTDAHVYIAHNSYIEEDCQIAAGVRICGSVRVGARVWLSPNVSIIQKVIIGHDTVIGMGSVVTKSMPSHVIAVGAPAKIRRPKPSWYQI